MKVYEIEAFKDASYRLFGILVTDKQIKEFVQTTRDYTEQIRLPFVYALGNENIIWVYNYEAFNKVLPGYSYTTFITHFIGAKGKAIPYWSAVRDSGKVCVQGSFGGVYSCGSLIFTKQEVIQKIQYSQSEKKLQMRGAEIKAKMAEDGRLYNVNIKKHHMEQAFKQHMRQKAEEARTHPTSIRKKGY